MADSTRVMLGASVAALLCIAIVSPARADGAACVFDGVRGAPVRVNVYGPAQERFQLAFQTCEASETQASDAGFERIADGLRFVVVPDRMPLARFALPSTHAPYNEVISAAARAHGLDPLLLHAIIYVESRHRADAVSPRGAIGLMQVMPETGRRFGVENPAENLFDETRNVDAGAAYLAFLSERFNGRLDLILAAYNAGEGAVARYRDRVPPYGETRAYVAAVTQRYAELRAEAQR